MLANSTMNSASDDAVNEAARQPHKTNGHDPRLASKEPDADVEAVFHALARQWIQETGMLSNLKQSYLSPSYQQIIGLGPAVVPVILRELKSHPNH